MTVVVSTFSSSVSDPRGTKKKIVSFYSYLYFPSWNGYYCSLTVCKQIRLAVRFQGEKPFDILRKMVTAHCLLEMVGEGKMEVLVQCQ